MEQSPSGVNNPRPAYQANVQNVDEDTIDCGIKVLKCCNTAWFRQFGTTNTFLTVLIFLAIVQGISENFIWISAQQAALEHDYDANVIDWLIKSHGIIQALLAILIAYWGNRMHKITWLCGMIAFQAVTSFLIIIPTISHAQSSPSESTFDAHSVNLLCANQMSASFGIGKRPPHTITTLVGLFILQAGISYGFIAFYTLGLTYLDDNSIENISPALIAAAIAAKTVGIAVGNALSMVIHHISFGWWLGWAILSPLIFIAAIIIGMFPRRMLESVIRQAADTIVETATNGSQISLPRTKFLSDISFRSTIGRLFRNKILFLNIFATVFIETALINFALQEPNYLRSRFLLPADTSGVMNNEWTSRTITKFTQPFVVALAILIGGLIISKATPTPRKIIIWNLITAMIVCSLFIGFIFIECSHNSIAGAHGKRLDKPYCSRHCICDPNIRFTPVCPEDGVQTFYSPCLAGCQSMLTLNGIRIFGNCTCGIDSTISVDPSLATEGACGYESCQYYWILFQVLSAFGAVCIGSRLVGKILISIRSVLRQDTAIALGLELTIVGLIAYVPGKIAYDYIADVTCNLGSPNAFCYLHDSHNFGNAINILSAVLSSIAVILEFVILLIVRDIELYAAEDIFVPRPIEMQPMNPINSQRADVVAQNDAPEAAQPLLAKPTTANDNTSNNTPHRNASRPSSPAIQRVESPKPAHTETGTGSHQSMANRFVASTASTSSAVCYSPVYKASPEYIEELNTRLQALNRRVTIDVADKLSKMTYVNDINPSVGSDTEKESELNIQQLESALSSLSGMPSGSTANSPELSKGQRNAHLQHSDRYETNF